MKSIKYLLLGVVVTLSGLFVFLNQQEVKIDFLFVNVVTKVSTAVAITFVSGMLSGVLTILLFRSSSEKKTPEEKAREKMSEKEAEEVHGIPLK